MYQTGVEIRIIDPETGDQKNNGEKGLIEIKGPSVFPGYLNDPIKTKETLSEDGWLATGDIGTLSADGFISYHGRLKDMLKVGGENVAALEIESFYNNHDGIMLTQVVGIEDERLGEVAALFVEKKEGSSQELFEHIIAKVKNAPDFKLRNDYSSSFRIFDDEIIDKKYIHCFMELLICIKEKNYKKKNLTIQRDLLEAIYLGLIQNIEFIPEEFINAKGKPNQEWCTMYIEGRKVIQRPTDVGFELNNRNFIPQNYKSIFRKLKESTNQYSHVDENEFLKYPFLTNTFGLLELIDWLPGFIDENLK